jgi:electron transfer flavoprotein beta subunit
MGMNIVVCVKRTPASTSVALDASGQVKTDGIQHAINPFDEYAVEEALRIKEKVGDATVTILSAGAPESSDVVKAALALGAQAGVVVTDPAFKGHDTMATSHVLAKAIEKIAADKGGVSLVLFGKQTNDGESGHVTAAVGAWLKWPSVTSVRKVADISAETATIERMVEDGIDTLKLTLPATVGVTKEINEPRLPSLKGKMAAKKAQLDTWSLADIGADSAIAGGTTETVKQEPVPARPAGTVIEGETPEELAKNLVAKLKETKFI